MPFNLTRWLFLGIFNLTFTSTLHADDLKTLSDNVIIARLADMNVWSPVLSWELGDSYSNWLFFGSKKPNYYESASQLEPPAIVQDAMREIVRRGAAIMPILLTHLSDNTPTKLSIGNSLEIKLDSNGKIPSGFYYWSEQMCSEYELKDALESKCKGFSGKYTMTVGDICYAPVGQIVGREFNAARYQPTRILIVNSPAHMPELLHRIRADWADLTPDKLRSSLLSDIDYSSDKKITARAMRRIRFYFSGTFEKFSGQREKEKMEFEMSTLNE